MQEKQPAKRTYRNALRSRAMIREAVVQLMQEKELDSITVVDVVRRADLSRNTFYAHYPDVYAVMEEFQDETIAKLTEVIEEAAAKGELGSPRLLLQKGAEYIDQNRDMCRLLLNSRASATFVPHFKRIMLEQVERHMDVLGIRDRRGCLLFMGIITAGYIELFQHYLNGKGGLTSDEIVREVDRVARAGLTLYM